MTVAELIVALRGFDPAATVFAVAEVEVRELGSIKYRDNMREYPLDRVAGGPPGEGATVGLFFVDHVETDTPQCREARS